MLRFYHDLNLKVGNSQSNPKRFLSPLKGISNKYSVLYLADTYQATVTSAAAIGNTFIVLDKTDEFLPSGTAVVTSNSASYSISYTGKTSSNLTGVTGITAAININDTVKPSKVYKTNGNVTITPSGIDLQTVNVSVGTDGINYSYPNQTSIFSKSSYNNITDSPIAVYVNISCLPGIEQDFTNWSIITNPIYVRDINDSTPISNSEIGNTIICYSDLSRRDNFQNFNLRVLPVNRAISQNTPGFILGSYRWRDSSTINSQILLPTTWDANTDLIGNENFLSGVSTDNDLTPIDIESINSSIYLRIKNGFYFAGPTRYFLPSNPQINFIPASQTGIFLNPKPSTGLPIFVGTWILDSNNFYRIDKDFRYQAAGAFNTNSDAPIYQYVFNKQTNLLNINFNLQPKIYFLGVLSGQSIDYFDVPAYPLDSISSVYVDRGVGNLSVYSSNFSYDSTLGVLTVTSPTNSTPSIPNAFSGEPVYAVCNPAYAVIYDSGIDQGRVISELDLNPAFSGISSGYIYLQHRRQKPTAITISVDKPIIDIPATYSSIIDLIAYGPIYYNGDYALLTVQTFGPLGNEIIPNAEVQIIPGVNFSGTINYQDPTQITVTGITGADGKVNFLYLPDPNSGYYIPTQAAFGSLSGLSTTTVNNDSLVLPVALPISEVFNTSEGWLIGTYNVLNTDPLFGLQGGDVTKGQIPFIGLGTIGTSNYKTNGEKVVWATGNVPITPINAFDINGKAYTDPAFNGNVIKLVYNQALQTTSNIGSYFINFLQRVSLQVELVNSNVISNTVLLQMAISNPINQDPWLTLDNSTQGILNQYRLGWQKDLPNSF